jgi:transmembrane sensor
MIVSKPENRIVKYLLKEATVEDLNELSDWILVKGNEQVFTEFVRTHYEINTAMVKPDVKQIKEILKKRMKRDKYVFPYRKVRSLMKYAAVGLVFLVLGYFFQQNQGNNPGKIEPKEEAITITLDNGSKGCPWQCNRYSIYVQIDICEIRRPYY